MTKDIEALKEYFYKNLYQLNEISTWRDIDSRLIGGILGKINPSEIKSVCKDCDLKGTKCNLMSGFSHSSDLEELYKKSESLDFRNSVNEGNAMPILFLCENPGRDYWNKNDSFDGKMISYESLNYWFSKTSDFLNKDLSVFPKSKNELYSNGFAHLMTKYKLTNVLITNSIKCKPVKKARFTDKELNLDCMKKFLLEEIRLFKPKVIICFDRSNAWSNLMNIKSHDPILFKDIVITNTFHPSARKSNESIKNSWYSVFDKQFKTW